MGPGTEPPTHTPPVGGAEAIICCGPLYVTVAGTVYVPAVVPVGGIAVVEYVPAGGITVVAYPAPEVGGATGPNPTVIVGTPAEATGGAVTPGLRTMKLSCIAVAGVAETVILKLPLA